MLKKERTRIVIIVVVLLCFFAFAVIRDLTRIDPIACDDSQVQIGRICCADIDSDDVCDAVNYSTPKCGDSICDSTQDYFENCSSCWKDCGVCKHIIYVEIPRNYTLTELTADVNALLGRDMKFSKDVEYSDDASNFFIFKSSVDRTLGEVLSTPYAERLFSRRVLLSNIAVPTYYVTDSASFLKYLNYTEWYNVDQIILEDHTKYYTTVMTGQSKLYYPKHVSGYNKLSEFDDWVLKNFTARQTILFDNRTIIEEGIAETIYAATWKYDLKYKYHEYQNRDEDNVTTIEGIRDFEELELDYLHSMSFMCSEDLMVTLYDYDYPHEFVNERFIGFAIENSRTSLLDQARRVQAFCKVKYSDQRFTYFKG